METKDPLQLVDTYVKEFSINVNNKIDPKQNLEVEGQLAFRMVNVQKLEQEWIGQIELMNNIELSIQKNIVGNIHIVMGGLWNGNKELEKSVLEEMLKITGVTTLSHIMRAYVHTTTSLAGMPTINIPMINFVEFFKKAEEMKEKNTNKK